MNTYKMEFSDKTIESIKRTLEIISAANTESMNRLRDTLQGMSVRLSENVMSNTYQNVEFISKSMQQTLSNFAQAVTRSYSYEMEGIRQSVIELSKKLSDMQIEQLKTLSQIDFRKINFDFHSKEFDDLIDLAYEATIEDTSGVTVSKEELKETFIESPKDYSSWKKFNIHLSDGMEKFKRAHFIFYIIMMFLMQHIFFAWFDETIGKHVIPKTTSIVRELPEKDSEIICHLEQSIEAIIVENQNYYYKVSFIDENGIEREGYVAKRNLKIIDQKEDSDEQPTVSGNDSYYLDDD